MTETWKDLRELLAEILALQEEKGGDLGCEIREDNHAWGFRFRYYDGELLLSCHPETHGCTAPQSLARNLAMEMEKSWDTDGFQSKCYQAHMQGELCGRLRGYLESWTGFREITGTAPGPGPFLSPRPLEPPRRDSAHGDPPCPLGTYMLCWRGVLQFNAILKASF